MEPNMFVNSAIKKEIEKPVYNNKLILFMIGNNIIVNSAVMKHHVKQNCRNIWRHLILKSGAIVNSVIKKQRKGFVYSNTATYKFYSWQNLSGGNLFVILSHCSHSWDSIMIWLHRFLQVYVPQCFITTLLTLIS